jgi:hypothetical protein
MHCRYLTLSLGLALATVATDLRAVAPAISGLQPWGLQRGTEVELAVSGARLGDAQELMFYSPGLKTLALKPENENLVKVKLAVAGDCRLGVHAVRLRSATGVSNLLTFTVGALPVLDEIEPNNEFTSPQAIPLGCVVHGVVQNEDVDYFVVEAKKGDRITAELEGIRLGYTFFDPYLAILNAQRFELSRSDDTALLRQDCLCAVVAPADGRYIIQVRESAYGGNGECKYRLHVGRFPRPTAVFPGGGKPGETLTVRWIGDPAGDWTEQVTLPAAETPEYGLFPHDAQSTAPSANYLRVVDLPHVLETEPNDAPAQAPAGQAPGAFNGIIEKPGDVDYFKFAGKKGQVFDIRVYARTTLRSPLDSVLAVCRADGVAIASNDDSSGPDSYLRFTVPADGDYLLQVSDQLRSGGPNFVYRVELAVVKPGLTMALPEKQQYVPTTLAVARGNRAAVLVNASRANWSGELNIRFEGLPPGISVQAAPMTAALDSVPVLFAAAADAPLGGSLTDVTGRPADANLGIVGHLEQRTPLVRGQNNVDVWWHTADRMAAAVTEAMPFEIELVPPKAPIVRNGNKDLRILVKRQPGFQQPINIRLLYNPPGIASSGAISIPGDKSEGILPLTANNNAAIGIWPIAVLGTATVNNGPVEVATSLVPLTIAEAYFKFTFDKAAAELGQTAQLLVKVETAQPYGGEAEVRLLGLPANTSTQAEPVKLNKDSTQFTFPIKVAEAARPGAYRSLVCQAVVTQDGEPVMHTLGTGELRVDAPLPKAAAPKPQPPPPPQAQPQPAPAPAAKPLSRLEKLRLERTQGEKKP